MRGYKEINYRAMKAAAPGRVPGHLFLLPLYDRRPVPARCCQSAARDAQVELRLVEARAAGPGPSHPVERAGDGLFEVLHLPSGIKTRPIPYCGACNQAETGRASFCGAAAVRDLPTAGVECAGNGLFEIRIFSRWYKNPPHTEQWRVQAECLRSHIALMAARCRSCPSGG